MVRFLPRCWEDRAKRRKHPQNANPMRSRQYIIVIGLIAVVSAAPQTTVNPRTQSESVDFATETRPTKTGTMLPQTCAVGETFFKTNAAPGQSLYGCSSNNNWTLQGCAWMPGLIWRGTWSASTPYASYNIVAYSGSSYVATADSLAVRGGTPRISEAAISN